MYNVERVHDKAWIIMFRESWFTYHEWVKLEDTEEQLSNFMDPGLRLAVKNGTYY